MIKKLKKFYKQNRIYCILMMISIFCIVLMGSAVLIYFISQATTSKYGHRLDGIEDYEVETELETLDQYYTDTEGVQDVNIDLEGKIIYVNVTVEDSFTNEEIQNLATSSLDNLTDDQKSYYDIQFIFLRESYTPYMGSKSSSNTIISWINYDFDTEDDTDTE